MGEPALAAGGLSPRVASLVELVEADEDGAGLAVLRERVRLERERALAASHPAFLLQQVQCVDQKTGERFEFDLLTAEERAQIGLEGAPGGWHWQREFLDWLLGVTMAVVLKGRQLGVTWIAAGLALHYLLYRPGSNVLVYSISETDAADVVARIWGMFESLPEHLRNGVEVISHTQSVVRVQHPDGRISEITAMPATKKAGHGQTAALVILDEFAHQDYARQVWKAVVPTMSDGGKLVAISTANGTSNKTTGEGNYFHRVWVTHDELDVERRFLKWDLHPKRDQDWWDHHTGLDPTDRSEQFPNTPEEAFISSGRPYFDRDSLAYYSREAVLEEPLMRGDFEERRAAGGGRREAVFVPHPKGALRVWKLPVPGRRYAIGSDQATGSGLDYSSAHVIDLATHSIAATMHGQFDADLWAAALHYLGRLYNTALIAHERAGGYGDALTVLLRDGNDGRPPYPKLYRHVDEVRSDEPERKQYGWPTNSATRPLILEGLKEALRDRAFDGIPSDDLGEMKTFVRRNVKPTPRHDDGCNDDRVFSLAIACEMFRRFGRHPDRHRLERRGPAATTAVEAGGRRAKRLPPPELDPRYGYVKRKRRKPAAGLKFWE